MTIDDWSTHINAEHLDASLPVPLYHQIYLLLRDKIRAGSLKPGLVLLGEQDLARLFAVSRITVKRSLNELASDGLVERHRGRGTVVLATGVLPVVKGSFDTLIQSLHTMGIETQVELLGVEVIEADEAVAHHLAVAPGTPVQCAVRRRKLEGEPFSHVVSFVPQEIAKRYSVADLAVTPLLVLLERAGATAQSAEQWITAVAAEPLIAAALGVPVSTALLRVERVMRAARGVPIQLIHAHYRPDRFQYHVLSHRRRGTGNEPERWRDDS
jgi:GntR family transcriptional regulator